ncbi:MAG: hypothetical protein ACWGN7_07640, partial [Thermodesulfovibrionales bacterium]
AREIFPLDASLDSDTVKVELRIPPDGVDSRLREVKSIVSGHAGKSPLYVRLTVDGYETLISARMRISVDRDVVSSFERVLGKNAVRIDYHENLS